MIDYPYTSLGIKIKSTQAQSKGLNSGDTIGHDMQTAFTTTTTSSPPNSAETAQGKGYGGGGSSLPATRIAGSGRFSSASVTVSGTQLGRCMCVCMCV